MSSPPKGTFVNVFWSGIALASDGYNAQALSSANVLFKKIYPDAFTSEVRSRISTAYYVGVCLASIFFGCIIDRFSRKTGVLLATLFLLLGVALCTGSSGVTAEGLFWMLTVSRGVLGFGAGGEYPVSSTAATEAGDETEKLRKKRGLLVGLVGCTAIDFGIVMAGITPLIILAGYGYTANTPSDVTHDLESVWRVTMGLGCIIPLTVFYFRWKMVTSTRFAESGLPNNQLFSPRLWCLIVKTYWRRMIGTCMCWALYDAVAYPFGLFTSTIIDQLSGGDASLIHSIGYGALINAFLLPGCIVGAYAMDYFGRRNTQALGFGLQTIVAFILGGALFPIQTIFPLFVVLYGVLLALGEAGPGVATILISAESYPTMIRGIMVGLSAAFGKAGAAVGTVVFGAIQDRLGEDEKGQQGVFLVGAAFSALGAIISMLCLPDSRSNVNLQEEDDRFNEILRSNGIILDINSADTSKTQSISEVEKHVDDFKPVQAVNSL